MTNRAFLWESGAPMQDLNNLVVSGSGVQVSNAFDINNRGEISAIGILPIGDTHAIVLIPCDENHPGIESCDYSMVEASPAPSIQSTVRATPGRTQPTALWQRNNNRLRFPGRIIGQRN